MIRLALLGTVQLLVDTADGADTIVAQRKPLGLLAYLAAASPPGFRRRDELIGLLWPDLDAAHGRRALSQALFVLRGALGADVITSRGSEEVGLDERLFWSDVAAFRTAAGAGRSEEAMSYYRGDLLPGFFLSEALEYERWLELQRATLRSEAAALAWGLARDQQAARPEIAVDWGRRAMTLAPYDESGLRRLLDLLDHTGDRAGAIQAYTTFAEQLERDLDVSPSAETTARAEAIRSRAVPSPETAFDTPARDLEASPVFGDGVQRQAAVTAQKPATLRARIGPSVAAMIGLGAIIVLAGAAITYERLGKTPTSGSAPARRERLLIADFAHAPRDSSVAAAVTAAIRLDISHSPLVSVISPTAVRDALKRMRRDTASRLDPTVAREIAMREGAKAVLEGDVRRAGGGFVLSARLAGAANGDLVQGWRETARDSSEVLPALDRLSQAIRRRLGESLESVRDGPHPLRVTTASFEALQRHAMGTRAFQAGDFARAAALFEEAVRLDSTFADAWVVLSIALSTQGVRPARQIEAVVKAYNLRDRLPLWERYAAEGFYALRVRGDLLGAIASLRNHAEVEPVDAFWATIGTLLIQVGQYEEAERISVRAIDVSPTASSYVNLARARFALRGDSAASAVVVTGLARYARNPGLENERLELMLGRGELRAADSTIHGFPSRGGDLFPTALQASLDAMRGKLVESEQHLRSLQASRDSIGLYADALNVAISVARGRLCVARDTGAALAAVAAALARHPLRTMDARERLYVPLSHFYVEAGRFERASALLKEYDALVPADYRAADRPLLLRTRAMLRIARGEAAEGVAELRDLERERPSRGALVELARGYERLGLIDSALAAYARYLSPTPAARLQDDGLFLADVLQKAGTIEDRRHHTAAALDAYGRLESLWREADRSLQPRRDTVVQRINALRATATTTRRRPFAPTSPVPSGPAPPA
jgi:DNA-binding SARP family transcriptional activator/TolB-like protein/Flp pilus assembly protein TadD